MSDQKLSMKAPQVMGPTLSIRGARIPMVRASSRENTARSHPTKAKPVYSSDLVGGDGAGKSYCGGTVVG